MMKYSIRFITACIAMTITTAVFAEDQWTYRFDMGTPLSSVKDDYIQITRKDTYTKETGYGWKDVAYKSFDSGRSRAKAEWYQKFWGEQVVGSDMWLGEPVEDPWRDGISDKNDMVFMADVPNGIYNVYAWIGDEYFTRLDMNIAAEDSVVCEDIRTWIFWGAYPAHRRVMFRTEVTDGRLDIRFFNHGKDIPITLDTVETVHEVLNSVLAIEIEPYYAPRLTLADGTLSGHNDLMQPEVPAGFEWFRQGRYDKALETWEGVGGENADEIKGILYGWLAGVVPLDDEIEMLDKAIEHLKLAARRNPGEPSITQTLNRTETFRDGLLIYRGEKIRDFLDPNSWLSKKRYRLSGQDMLLQATPNEPFYLKGRFEIATEMYWNLRESGGTDRKGLDRPEFVRETMEKVLAAYPNYDLAKIYLGQKVPWGLDYQADAGDAPRWAALAREVLSRQRSVIFWWVNHQAPDGSMGGDQSYGDDVEMLRSWPGVVLATGDRAIVECIRKMADGVYATIAPNGYNQHTWDVQHSAEPTADPAFITRFDYGNPVHIERGLAFMKLYRDLFTGINERGHRHFRSINMGVDGVVKAPPFSCDTHYHVRAAKPGLWTMWYTGLPEINTLMTEWADSWYEDAMRAERGKPAGVMPSAVAFDTDRIGGYGPENDWKETASGYDYYNWNPGESRLYNLMYTMWRHTGKEDYLKPMFMAPMPSTVVTWRAFTGDTSHDDIIESAGGAYGRYLTTGDVTHLEKALEGTLNHLRYNFALKTSEVTMTDRIRLGDTSVIHGMYTGGVPANDLPYTLGAISWADAGTNYAALVRENSPDAMRISVYSFTDAPHETGIRFWELERGTYEVRLGPDTDDDGHIDGDATTVPFTMDKRGDEVRITLPSRRLMAIEITQTGTLPPVEAPLPDMAIVPEDVEFARELPAAGHGTALSAMVHSIGGTATGAFRVSLFEERSGKRRLIDSVRFPGLDAPHGFEPKREPVALAGYVNPGAVTVIIAIDPENGVDEINEQNNEAVFDLNTRDWR